MVFGKWLGQSGDWDVGGSIWWMGSVLSVWFLGSGRFNMGFGSGLFNSGDW